MSTLTQILRASIDGVLAQLQLAGALPEAGVSGYQIETPKHAAHGDFSTNVAMLLAKTCDKSPRELATRIAGELGQLDVFARCEVAGPGFINFVVNDRIVFDVVPQILAAQAAYGRSSLGQGRKVQVEFVSANPTGPLHIGHGRGAAVGSVLANLLTACGFVVEREYYVNDVGRQMDILALSVWLRYLQAAGVDVEFPAQAYRGDYIEDIARELRARHADDLVRTLARSSTTADGDAERRLDNTIEAARTALGAARFGDIRDLAKNTILAEIQADLAAFGVQFDRWYSEASLEVGGLIDDAISVLDERGHIFNQGGARWFRSSTYGDEKDRVIVRENGAKTYFASDIAYHREKFQRGFAEVIDIWGADHHGYIDRVKAALVALGIAPERLDIVLVQFASLVRGGEKVAMSTRAGEFVTLRQLVQEVGVDAARFFYVMRRSDQHLEFDLDLATAQSSDNPVYYVQYAHARICSVFRQQQGRPGGLATDSALCAERFSEAVERRIAVLLWRFPEVLEGAAVAREPHQLTNYLRDLATEFHAYYNAHKVLVDDADLRLARLRLIEAVRQVIANGLAILAIRAPTEM